MHIFVNVTKEIEPKLRFLSTAKYYNVYCNLHPMKPTGEEFEIYISHVLK